MLVGVDAVVAKITMGDEFGVYRRYRQTDYTQEFLLFTDTNRNSCLKNGTAVADALGVPFMNQIPDNAPDTQEEIQEAKETQASSKKRVTGIRPKVIDLIRMGKTDPEIVDALIHMYTDAGRTEEQGRALLKPYVAEIRKGL